MQQLFWPCSAIIAASRSSKQEGCRRCSSVLTFLWHAQSNIILPCSRWRSRQQKQRSDHSIKGCHPGHCQAQPISCMRWDRTMQDTSAWRRHCVRRQPQKCEVLISSMLRKLPDFTMNWLQPRTVSCLPLHQLNLMHLAWMSRSSARGA